MDPEFIKTYSRDNPDLILEDEQTFAGHLTKRSGISLYKDFSFNPMIDTKSTQRQVGQSRKYPLGGDNASKTSTITTGMYVPSEKLRFRE